MDHRTFLRRRGCCFGRPYLRCTDRYFLCPRGQTCCETTSSTSTPRRSTGRPISVAFRTHCRSDLHGLLHGTASYPFCLVHLSDVLGSIEFMLGSGVCNGITMPYGPRMSLRYSRRSRLESQYRESSPKSHDSRCPCVKGVCQAIGSGQSG